MRLKEFLIFIGIFTVFYIIFFIVFDKLSIIKTKKEALKKAESLITVEQFNKFAAFYGFQATATLETILNVYKKFGDGRDCIISEEAKLLNLSNIEFVIIFLYLEYLGLINKKMISIEMDSIKKTTFVEQNIMQKYYTYLQDKQDLDTIVHSMGQNALNDLTNMNNNYLMPGVRMIDSKLYYVGDYL